jgi:hypothetical protein
MYHGLIILVFLISSVLLLYISDINNYVTKALCFPKIYNHKSLYGRIISGPNVDPTSSSFLRHVGITDYMKSKTTILE